MIVTRQVFFLRTILDGLFCNRRRTLGAGEVPFRVCRLVIVIY